MGDNDAEINPQWTGPAEHIFPSLTTGAGFLTEEARQTEVTPKKLLLVHSSCTWNFMVAVLIQSMSRWISHGGKPSWCCSKKWTRTHPPQWFFSGQWVNQDVQPYNSLNPWEKQILKKKKVFKWYFLYSLPSKWKDLHLLYLPLKQFKWLPWTGFIAELRLHIIVNPNLCLWTFFFFFFLV